MTENRRWTLRARPSADNVAPLMFEKAETLEPQVGEVLVRNIYLSIDPTHRIWMSDVDQYMPPVALGAVMRGLTIGVVEQSAAPDLPAGTIVAGLGNWQDYATVAANALTRINPLPGVPLSAYHGPLGSVGATAYFGIFEIGRPKPGETVVVSAAAGAVGSLAGQMAKLIGCRVVGIVGSRDKADWLTGELGFDAAVIHRAPDLVGQLRAACPQGIDVYFDNVGGDVLDAALTLINQAGRVAVCGLISTYGSIEEGTGPKMFRNVLMKRVRVEGFIVSDYRRRYPEAYAAIGHWLATGALKYRVDVRSGLENARDVLADLFAGTNSGKLMVQVSPEP